MEQAILDANRQSRERLSALLDRLTDEQMALPLDAGWTVGASLAHLAFWDRRVSVLINRWASDGVSPSPSDADVINDAMKPAWLALTPAAVRAETRAAADEADATLANLSPGMWQAIASGNHLRLARDKHRNEHVAEIESALSAPR